MGPASRRPTVIESECGFLWNRMRLVGEWSVIGKRLFDDLTAMMTLSDNSSTNWRQATDQFKSLFDFVGDQSFTVPIPISNQLHLLPEGSSVIFMNFDRWEFWESLQRCATEALINF